MKKCNSGAASNKIPESAYRTRKEHLFSKTLKNHKLQKIKSKCTFNCDLFCCQIIILCKATFQITVSYFNGKRNPFFRHFSVLVKVKYFVCHLVAALWSLWKSPVLLGFRCLKFGHNLPKMALKAGLTSWDWHLK